MIWGDPDERNSDNSSLTAPLPSIDLRQYVRDNLLEATETGNFFGHPGNALSINVRKSTDSLEVCL